MSSKILDIVEGINRERFPKVTKNSCGYRMDAVSSVSSVHKILAGSEGTLGIIVSARLKVHAIPAGRSLSVYGYGSPYDAADDCKKINRINPAALELVDGAMMRNAMSSIPEWVKCLLLVEADNGLEGAETLEGILKGRLIKNTRDAEEIKKWWRYRHTSLLLTLRNMSKVQSGPHIFEDAAVPVENLQD